MAVSGKLFWLAVLIKQICMQILRPLLYYAVIDVHLLLALVFICLFIVC